jgi:VacB/RNase II family 3'-5' exoribonuclease
MSDHRHPHRSPEPVAHGEHHDPPKPGAPPEHGHRADLRAIAHRVMEERGLEPDFPEAEKREVAGISRPADGKTVGGEGAPVADLRQLLWSSIDNDDSLDLDQLEVAARQDGSAIEIRVAIADVDALVPQGSQVDKHAAINTTSVYTPAQIFPMLPEKLSTDLTSLAAGQDRLAVVITMVVQEDGEVSSSRIERAMVHNWAKLAYHAVGDWFEDKGPLPPAAAAVSGMEEQLRIQDEAAQRLRRRRCDHGALSLQTIQTRAVWSDGHLTDLETEAPNRAKQLIEDFMIAANGVTATFLDAQGFPSLRRVVRTPKRWPRIVELAAGLGERLPADPDSQALEAFLDRRRRADPVKFPDLSVAVVKLLGSGEYVLDRPGAEPPGHFGLAVRNYAHSTAPNRRYPDVIAQRLLKAALAKAPVPYREGELAALATHCTEQEDAAQKVERQVQKSAAALLLAPRIGQHFDGIVTGAADKGTWVRIFHPPVEGRVVHGFHGMDVGDRVRVKLVSTDVERGFIDFVG